MAFRIPLVRTAWAAALAGLALGAWPSPGAAQNDDALIKLGETEYMSQCAACHGAKGHGDGPVASVLTKKPPDLTKITERYSGSFPTEQLHEMIDGRNMINPHGDRGMPVWGDRYFQTATEEAHMVPHDVDAQALAYGRITALVRYLGSIQAE